ncbi:MAG: hypothetical protein J6N78_05145 [Clostridia bacterium]|nr:hypothetical protein [Clostridia bacterium]
MGSNNQEYIDNLNRYLDADIDDDYESDEDFITEDGIDGNVKIEDIRDVRKTLLYLVIDQSVSMRHYGLEDAVRRSLADVKNLIDRSYEKKGMMTATTFFGSELDIRPFQEGECIDISYVSTDKRTRLYDAIVESCKNMINQYDKLKYSATVGGVMLIFTDGGIDKSENYDICDARYYLNKLRNRDITYLLISLGGKKIQQLCRELNTEPVSTEDCHQLRRRMMFVSEKPR